MEQHPVMKVRAMQPGDAAMVVSMMGELAIFENKTDFRITEADLLRWCREPSGQFDVLVAELAADATQAPMLVGYAAHYLVPFMDNLRPALMLKGLFVAPALRGNGIGHRLFTAVAQVAKDKDCGRFQWFVLHANQNAQAFYMECGALPDTMWERWNFNLPPKA